MSKIDDTLAAIKTAEETLSETVSAIQAAIGEAEEAQNGLLTFGAEASAELMAKSKEALEQAVAACNAVSSQLEDASSAAQEAV